MYSVGACPPRHRHPRRAPQEWNVEYAYRDGTNTGVAVYNNARLVALEWEKWVTAVLVANGGWLKADQDLTNLAIGRQDIPVHYMPGRYNVHLGIPDTVFTSVHSKLLVLRCRCTGIPFRPMGLKPFWLE